MTAHMSPTPAYLLEDWIDTSNLPNDSYVTVSVHSMNLHNNLNVGIGADFPVNPSADSIIYMPSLSTAADFTPSNVSILPASILNSLSQMFYESSICPNSPESYRSDDGDVTQSEEAREPPAIEPLTISTAFQETPHDPKRPSPDVILISSDAVIFYVDQNTLLKSSNNNFADLLPITAQNKLERVRHLPQIHSSELNIILHILYNFKCAQFNPSLHLIISSIDHLPKYGIPPNGWITKGNAIYDLLLPHAPIYPLQLYCLCGRHDMYELSKVVSPHLLSFDLSTLTDEDAEAMGSLYLARLFQLHRSRVETLLHSLMPVPALHNPTRNCGFDSQKVLSSAWMMIVAYLSWSATPDISTSAIRSIFHSMTTQTTCKECLKGRDERVNKIVVNWTLTKNTI